MSSSKNIVGHHRPYAQNDTNNAKPLALDRWSVARANAGIKKSINDLKEGFVDIFNQQQSLYSKILLPLKDLNEAEVHAVCDNILGLDPGSCSDSDDIIHCILHYEMAVQYASMEPKIKETSRRKTRQMKDDDGENNMTLDVFYNIYMHSTVERAWSFVCQSFGLKRNTTISKKSGMVCTIGHRYQGKMRRPYRFAYQTFPSLFNRLKEICEFLLINKHGPDIISVLLERKTKYIKTRSLYLDYSQESQGDKIRALVGGSRVDQISINPSIDKINSFLRNKQGEDNTIRIDPGNPSDNGTKNTDNTLAVGDTDSICGNVSHDNCKTIQGRDKTIGGSSNTDTLLESKAYSSFLEWTSTKKKTKYNIDRVEIDKARSYEDILELMPSAELTTEGEVKMDRSDSNLFINSPFVSALVIEELYKMFRSNENKSPQTLDVILGMVNDGVCESLDGPTVKIFMQRHPTISNRYIPLTVLKDHLSNEFINSTVSEANDMPMHGTPHNQKFTRFSSKAREKGAPIPMATFGNSDNSRRLYEAHEIALFENHGATIATHTLRAMDNAYRYAISQIQLVMHSKKHTNRSNISNDGSKSIEAEAPFQNSQEKFVWPIGKPNDCEGIDAPGSVVREIEVIDAPDSVVVQISNGGVFGGHSDGEGRECNNSPAEQATHVEQMRVFTNSIVPDYQANEKMVTMRHGEPSSDEKRSDDISTKCVIIGYYSCTPDDGIKFIPWNKPHHSAIPITGKSSAHIQPHGSQCGIYHFPTSETTATRIVHSFRCMHRCQVSADKQKKFIIKNYPVIKRDRDDQITNVIGMLSGKEPFVSRVVEDNKKRKYSSKEAESRNNKRRKQSSPVYKKDHNKRLIPFYGMHANGYIEDYEMSYREKVSGLDQISEEMIATSRAAVMSLYEHDTTMLLNTGKQKDLVAGPFVVKEAGGEYRLLMPGEMVFTTELNAASGIKTTQMNRQIINPDHPDTVFVRRFCKNDPNILVCLESVKAGGEMQNVTLRGRGGAEQKAGMYELDITDRKSVKGGSTHLVGSSQRVDDPYHQSMLTMVQNSRVINLFVPHENNEKNKATFLGTYYVDRIEIKTTPEKTVTQLKENMTQLAGRNVTKQQVDSEMNGMLNPTMFIHLEPLDKNFMLRFKSGENVRWKVMRVTMKDIVKPKILFVDEPPMGSWQSRLHPGLPFLTADIKSQHGLEEYVEGDDDLLDFEDHDINADSMSGKRQFTFEQLTNGLLHSSLFTMARTVGPCVSTDGSYVTPPSFIFDGLITRGHYNNREDAYKKTHLQSLASRVVHPATICQDIVGLVAMYATESYDPQLRNIGEKGDYLHRFGRSYILDQTTQDNAWDIIFKATICSFIYPSALIQIQTKFGGPLVPLPNELEAFIISLQRFEWKKGNYCINKIFHCCFQRENADGLIEFLRKFMANGKAVIQQVVKSQTDRPAILEEIRTKLRIHCGITCNPFQMQVIARTIEVCLHEPFGHVGQVEGGSGGKMAAKAFIVDFTAEHNDNYTVDIACKMIHGWLVKKFNSEASDIMTNRNAPSAINRHKKELSVLGLEWSPQLKCIIHSIGIGKRYDASDSEHGGCCFQRMVKNNRGCNNVSNKISLDSSPKFPPIRVGPGSKLANELDILKEPRIFYEGVMLPAYEHLMSLDQYIHKTLHETFRIPFTKKVVSNTKQGDSRKSLKHHKLTSVMSNTSYRTLRLDDTVHLIPGYSILETGIRDGVQMNTDDVINYEELCKFITQAVQDALAKLAKECCSDKTKCKYRLFDNNSEFRHTTPMRADENDMLLLGLRGYNAIFVGNRYNIEGSRDLKIEDGTGSYWVRNKDRTWMPEDDTAEQFDLMLRNLAKGHLAKWLIESGDALMIPKQHLHSIVLQPGASLLSVTILHGSKKQLT